MRQAFALILIMLLLLPVSVKADIVTERPLGGMSKALDDYFNRPDVLDDVHVLSAVMELENGDGTDECMLLTGSVLMNRAQYCSWCPDTLRECVLQGYKTKNQQYATSTIKRLDKIKVTSRARRLAVQLLLFGQTCPKEVIYQSTNAKLGKVWKQIGSEYFATEDKKK